MFKMHAHSQQNKKSTNTRCSRAAVSSFLNSVLRTERGSRCFARERGRLLQPAHYEEEEEQKDKDGGEFLL